MQADIVGQHESPPAMAPGVMLRQAREVRGESREEVAYALKLSLRQLDALEHGDYAALPGPAFVRGFLRNYARHVGLDPAAVLAALGAEAGTAVDLTPLSNADGDMPVGRSARFNLVPAAAVAALLLALMFAGSYFGWFETEPPPPVAVEPFPPGGADALPAMPGADEPAAAGDAGAVEAEPAMPLPDPAPVTEPGAAAPAEQTVVGPAVVDPSSAQGVVAAAAPAAAPAAAAAPAIAPADGLRFAFSGESWVEVKDGSGALLYAGIGSAGSTREVHGRPPFALVIGNARSVRLEYQGKSVDLVPHTKVTVARLTLQ